MIFNIEKETLPREDIEALQLRRLQNLCARVYANVPFYRKRFDESGIKPGDIKSLADLKNLPFTEKQDLRNYYPFGLFAVPRDNIVRLHASSGTTGKAVVVGYTARDLHNWAELAGRSLSAAGVNQTDIVHVAYGYPRRGRAHRRHGGPGLGGRHAPPGLPAARFRRHGPVLYAFVRPAPVGGRPGSGHRLPRPAPAHRRVRRRTLDRGDAPGHRAENGHQRPEHLRPFRSHGPRRGHGMRGIQIRHAPVGRPLPARDHRPRHR